METADLARLVKEVRDAQREYFETRDRAVLAKSRRLEARLDEITDEILGAAAYAKGGQEWADGVAGMPAPEHETARDERPAGAEQGHRALG